MMRFKGLSLETRKQISKSSYDRIVEKHEGPWTSDFLIRESLVEFLNVDGFDVLLPVESDPHPNIVCTRCLVAKEHRSLTVFLQDSTYDKGIFAGYLAVCEQFPGQDWYLAYIP